MVNNFLFCVCVCVLQVTWRANGIVLYMYEGKVLMDLTISLQHRRFISSLCMLYKIFHNPSHPLHSELPNLFHPRRVTRGSLSINSLSFSPMRFHTSQYSRCFIPATTKLWNELPSMIVEATELQKFKIGANAFLLGVDGL